MSLFLPPPLAPSRLHEVQGAGAIAFAVMQAAMREGPVVWLRGGARVGGLLPAGVARFLDPSRLLVVSAPAGPWLLWAVEEALRSGAAGFVVAETEGGGRLSLTAGRRLQLAAEAGATTALLAVADGTGSPATETRWQATPLPDPGGATDSTLARWELIKNKRGTLGEWTVRWHDTAHSVTVVSPAGKRARFAAVGG